MSFPKAFCYVFTTTIIPHTLLVLVVFFLSFFFLFLFFCTWFQLLVCLTYIINLPSPNMLCPSLFQILTFGSLLGQSLAQLPDVLYRGDTRDPKTIIAKTFRDPNYPGLHYHTHIHIEKLQHMLYASTSPSKEIAKKYGGKLAQGQRYYIYHINTKNVKEPKIRFNLGSPKEPGPVPDQTQKTKALSEVEFERVAPIFTKARYRYPYTDEDEYALKAYIPWANVDGWTIVYPNGKEKYQSRLLSSSMRTTNNGKKIYV